jgi:hypothetical protein
MAEAAGSFPAGRTSLRAKALRLGKPAVVREGCRVVARRAKTGATNYSIAIGPVTVAAERSGFLIRWRKPDAGSNPAWSTKFALLPASVPQSAEGVRRERIQWEFDSPRTHHCSVTPLVRRLRCRRGERDSISLRSANSASLAQSAELSAHNGPGPGSSPGRCTHIRRAPLEWPAIGPENRGVRKDRGSNPQLSASFGKRQ